MVVVNASMWCREALLICAGVTVMGTGFIVPF